MSEIGVNKLFFHPQKMKKLMDTAGAGKFEIDLSYPVSVELSLTNRCNLKCVWCVDWHLRKKDKKELDFKALKNLILDLEAGGTRGITIEGGGEPTLYKHFNELMKFISKVKIKFGLITNGILIPYYNYVDRFEWIRVSLDVDSEDNYAKYKGGKRSDYNLIFKNLEKLVEKANKKTVIGVSYIATKHNMDNIISVIKKVKNAGADYFYIRPVEDHADLLPKPEEMEGLEKYGNKNFKVLVNYGERIERGNAGLPCIAHSLSSVISADGSVYLCGRLHIHPEWSPIGNCDKLTFSEIWKSSARKKQAAKVYNIDFTTKYCPVCRMTKFNKELFDLKNIKTINFL